MTLLLAFLLMILVVGGMAIGVLFGRRPLQGTCGGLAGLGLGECEICGGDRNRCERARPPNDPRPEGTLDASLGYDASGTWRPGKGSIARRDF
jgi:hypothetical protein